MKTEIKLLIEGKDYKGLRETLSKNPNLANKGISLDEPTSPKAHPLHRICDAVFLNRITDQEAIEIAKIFLEFGAHVNGYGLKEKEDTPLIAAASLHAEALGLYYIQNGADIHHAGCNGGTALHWAAWCGRDKLVNELIDKGADVNKKCIDFGATPLGWAIHGYKFGGDINKYNQITCVKLLVQHGADKSIANKDGKTPSDFLDETDTEMNQILN